MMHHVLLLIFLIFLASCSGNKSNTQEPESKNEILGLKEIGHSDLNTLFSSYHSEPSTLAEIEENKIIDYLSENEISAQRTSRGIYYHVIEKGSGNAIRWGENLKVDYKGYTLDGKVFDSSYKKGKPISFKVGNMIDGWNYSLTYLNKGDKAILYIPSIFGYGEQGIEGLIGSNEILVFEIEIKE